MPESTEDELTLEDVPNEISYRKPDIEPVFEDPCLLEGWYGVDPIPGGKRLQGVWLLLDDGFKYVIAYRPIKEQFQYINKRVLVHGRPYVPGSDTQHISATHLTIDSIELAPGEKPHEEIPQKVPLPPKVRTAKELTAFIGRWVQVEGTLQKIVDDQDSYLGIAQLKLSDGTEVKAWNVAAGMWLPYLEQWVNVISRVERVENEPALIGWYAVTRQNSKS